MRSQELVYENLKKKEWAIHTFKVIIKKKYVKEAKESWHIKKLLKDLTGREYEHNFPEVYRHNPEKWSPYFTIVPEHIVIGLKDKENWTVTIEKIIPERDVALRERSEVFELLKHEMEQFLESKGVPSDRRMKAAIRTEIEDIMDDSGVHEDKAIVKFSDAYFNPDLVGGLVLYVFLTSKDPTPHRIPVTPHLHDIKEKGRIRKDEFVSEVESILSEYNLSEEDLERAVEKCIDIMRGKELLKR